jgi:hypothetical protein
MQEQYDYADYQHDVNEAARNVKGKESKQPKNDQDRSDYSKHISNSFYQLSAHQKSICRAAHYCQPLVGSVLMLTKFAR